MGCICRAAKQHYRQLREAAGDDIGRWIEDNCGFSFEYVSLSVLSLKVDLQDVVVHNRELYLAFLLQNDAVQTDSKWT